MAKINFSSNRNSYRSESSSLKLEKLEDRNLLAGISFSGGIITVDGSAGADIARAYVAQPSEVTVVFNSNDVQTFDSSSVTQIVFYGRQGDDRFRNDTHIPTLAVGHAGNDILFGGSGADNLSGGNGNDILHGNGGDDLLFGHAGLDQLYGNTGNDGIWLGEGDDFSDGGDGNDQIFGHAGRDHLRGGSGDDLIVGHEDGDYLFGESGNDMLYGKGGADFIRGGTGNDRSNGGSGNDTILGDEGSDHLVGDVGDDWLSGGDQSDILFGMSGNDKMLGESGNDRIWGGAGDDILRGDDGNDSIGGGPGDDLMYGNDGDDDMYGNEGNDRLYGHAGNDKLFGSEGHDSVFGNTGDDLVRGNSGSDLLRGHSGSDRLDGGSENDDLAGGAGADRLKGGLGNDDYFDDSSDTVFDDAADYGADGDFEIRGDVSNLNTTAKTFDLLGLTVSYANARLEGSFQNGSLVKAEGNFASGVVDAYEVELENDARRDNFEARGLVANHNSAAKTFELFGIVVNYQAAQVSTVIEDGAPVFVEGNLASQIVTAREVHPGNGQDNGGSIDRNLELRGQVTNLDEAAQTFEILGVTVDYSRAFLQNQFSEGSFIKVDGDFDNNTLTARGIELEIDDNRDENVEALGIISNLDENAQTFSLNGISIDYSNADLEGNLENGIAVEVDGWFQNFAIDAEEVKFA